LTDFRIENSAIRRLAEIIAYAMAINLFLAGAEVFKEYYSRTDHLTSMKYLFQGLEGHRNLVAWTWAALAFNLVGFVIFLVPKLRNRTAVLSLGCVLVFIGVWVEKGMGLIFPGFIPNSLGEIYEYMPSEVEIGITVAIWAMGAMMYTLFVRAAIAIDSGRFRHS
jgi:molybdopterin-containing oxidoreductase family membrane subunit